MRCAGLAVAAALASVSCNGTTGFDLVMFYAAASGFSDATKGAPYTFEAPGGVRVTLTQATLHVGALYLTQSVPQPGGGPQPCVLTQTYAGAFVGEVRGEADVDLLDPSAQIIPTIGDGSTLPAATGQVWLVHDGALTAGTLNGPDPLPILTLAGSFEEAGGMRTFAAAIAIDVDRVAAGTANAVLPNAAQICQQRIVSGIPAPVTLAQGGTLVLQVDAAALFAGVPFSDLPPCDPAVSTADVCFTNDDSNNSSTFLYSHLKGTGPYRMAWRSSAP